MNTMETSRCALTCAMAMTLCCVAAGCSRATAQQQSPAADATTPHDVTLTQVQQRAIHVVTLQPTAYRTAITSTGVVDFDHNRATRIVAPLSGAVTRVPVSLGERVKKGQALADVESADFTAAAGAYRKAVLAARAADAVASNDRALYPQQAISRRENAQAQANAAGADAERDAARQVLVALHVPPATIATIRRGKTAAMTQGIIRSPIAGSVVAKSIAPGQTLAAGSTPCFTIADTSRMWVMAKLFGDQIGQVAVGDPATVMLDDGSPPVAGKVTHVNAVVNPETRAVTARIAVDTPHGELKKGMYVSVRIQSGQQKHGLLVPVSAVLRNEQNLPFVYRVETDGGYARRRVTLSRRIENRFVISTGLAAGDKVVVDGGIFLRFIQSQ